SNIQEWIAVLSTVGAIGCDGNRGRELHIMRSIFSQPPRLSTSRLPLRHGSPRGSAKNAPHYVNLDTVWPVGRRIQESTFGWAEHLRTKFPVQRALAEILEIEFLF